MELLSESKTREAMGGRGVGGGVVRFVWVGCGRGADGGWGGRWGGVGEGAQVKLLGGGSVAVGMPLKIEVCVC